MASENKKIAKTVLDAERFARSHFGRDVEQAEFYNRRYGTTTCACGEARCIWFVELNAKVERYITVSSYGIGICEHCGEPF